MHREFRRVLSDLIRVLSEASSEGLSVQKIARHVFNACNSLFYILDFEEVRAYVMQYLLRNSKNQNSIIERAERRGMYRLNYNSRETMQLMLQFNDHTIIDVKKSSHEQKNNLLSFFDDFSGNK